MSAVKLPRPKVAWSYSALSTFENCARKFWALRIGKVVSDINNDNLEGDADHQSLQFAFSKNLALPSKLVGLQPMVDKLKAAPGERYVEYQMCLRQDFTPTGFKNWDEAWVRGAGDLILVNGAKASYFDWKKGKPNTNDDQIELTSLLLFQHFPAVQQVSGGLVFYNHGKVHPHVVARDDAPRLWNSFIQRVKEMEKAKDEDNYPANPNPLCGWCPYKACPHNKQDERLAAEARGERWSYRGVR